MYYSMPDLKTQMIKHKRVSMVREERKDGMINFELKWASESATSVHKT